MGDQRARAVLRRRRKTNPAEVQTKPTKRYVPPEERNKEVPVSDKLVKSIETQKKKKKGPNISYVGGPFSGF